MFLCVIVLFYITIYHYFHVNLKVTEKQKI